MKHNHLGLSTVVGTALMLGAVAVIGSTIVMWSNSNVRSYETILATASSTRANAFNELLSIENLWFCHNPPPSQEPCHGSQITSYPAVNVTLTNVGSIGLNVTQITFSEVHGANTTTTIRNGGLVPGGYYFYGQSYTYTSKIPVVIIVTTARGSIFTTQVTPP